jgi:hypothetical protein
VGGEPFFLKSDQKSKTGVGGVLLILYDNITMNAGWRGITYNCKQSFINL